MLTTGTEQKDNYAVLHWHVSIWFWYVSQETMEESKEQSDSC